MHGPASPDLAVAEQALRRGDVPAALRLARDAASEGHDGPGWTRLHALALAASGLASEARAHFARYARACPDDADAWVNLGTACLESGDAVAAVDAFARAGERGATGVACLLGRGSALLATGRPREAEDWLRRAQALEPDAPDIRLARGQCLAELERHEELDDCIGTLEPAGLSFPQRTLLAWLQAQCGRAQAALALYQALLAEQPEAPEPRIQLALLLERLNRVDDAAALLDPHCFAEAVAGSRMLALARARIARRRGAPGQALEVLAGASGLDPDPAMAAQLGFEQAKCHDALGEADEAMAALASAHAQALLALRDRHPGLDTSAVLGWLGQRRRRPPAVAPRVPDPGEPPDPVFLVGFPRSGTTLLEQMLAAHGTLQVLDERPALEAAIAAMAAQPGWRDDDLDRSLDDLGEAALRRLRALYRDEAARHVPAEGRLVDKYPLYLTRLAHAQRLFPRSDWLLLLRHPCDCVLSCHFQAFGLNGGALAFATLESTARTYAEVMGYWEAQRSLLAPRVHVLRYEDLASDPAGTLEGLMAFLGLPLEPAQLAFQARVRAGARRINTPSYARVAEPVDTRAVGRWRRYRGHFTPETLALLAPWVDRWGYSLD